MKTLQQKLVDIVNGFNLKYGREKVYVFSGEFPDNYNVSGYSKKIALCVSYIDGYQPTDSFQNPSQFHNRQFFLACRGNEDLDSNDIELFLNPIIKKLEVYSDDIILSINLVSDLEDLGMDEQNRSLLYYPIMVNTVNYYK